LGGTVGQEWVTFPNGKQIKYGQAGGGFGAPEPGFGAGYVWGRGWNIDVPNDYVGSFWELQGAVFPFQISLSGAGIPFMGPTTVKGGVYFGIPGANFFWEEYGYEPQ
jgi:hypothetical protein